jgi:fimbrial chaperone protein
VAAAAVLGLGLLRPEVARPGNLQVSPVLIELSPQTPTALLTLRNDSPDRIRYEVQARAWRQSPQGEMILDPTTDVIFFPALLTLAPGEQRNVRVGTAAGVTPGEVERSYRIFVEELPPAVRPADATKVRVLTRVGIPVFLEPPKPAPRPEVTGMALAGEKLSFQIRNGGNVRAKPLAVRIVARGGRGEILSDKGIDVWYVLARGERLLDVVLPKERCAEARAVAVEVTLEGGSIRGELPAPRGVCAP